MTSAPQTVRALERPPCSGPTSTGLGATTGRRIRDNGPCLRPRPAGEFSQHRRGGPVVRKRRRAGSDARHRAPIVTSIAGQDSGKPWLPERAPLIRGRALASGRSADCKYGWGFPSVDAPAISPQRGDVRAPRQGHRAIPPRDDPTRTRTDLAVIALGLSPGGMRPCLTAPSIRQSDPPTAPLKLLAIYDLRQQLPLPSIAGVVVRRIRRLLGNSDSLMRQRSPALSRSVSRSPATEASQLSR